jgi:hypothetical protein
MTVAGASVRQESFGQNTKKRSAKAADRSNSPFSANPRSI